MRLIRLPADKPHKYRAKATVVDGVRFASQAEAGRYVSLQLLQRSGQIFDLRLQPRFDLIVNGTKVGAYVGDFAYRTRKDGPELVEDVKSEATKTAVYKLKKALMLACHGIAVQEVTG